MDMYVEHRILGFHHRNRIDLDDHIVHIGFCFSNRIGNHGFDNKRNPWLGLRDMGNRSLTWSMDLLLLLHVDHHICLWNRIVRIVGGWICCIGNRHRYNKHNLF